jgi:hypothetical protein
VAYLPGTKWETASYRPPAADQLDYQNHQRNDQEDVDAPEK